MKITYHNQSEERERWIKYKGGNILSKNWISKDTLDFWRPQQILKPLKEFITNGYSWLIIGDGRYGTKTNFLLGLALNAHTTDMSVKLLKESNKVGFLKTSRQESSELLNCLDNSFDYVLIKQDLHNFPSACIELHEALQVYFKEVFLIEPNDQLTRGTNGFKSVLNSLKNFFRKKFNIYHYNFEETGNFIFLNNLSELEKFIFFMQYENFSFIKINDYLTKGIKKIRLNDKNIKKKLIKYFLKSIFIKNILSKMKFDNYSITSVALFKQIQQKSPIENFKKLSLEHKKLLQNQSKK